MSLIMDEAEYPADETLLNDPFLDPRLLLSAEDY
jgi:hypothetical protein